MTGRGELFKIIIYDKDRQFTGQIGNPSKLTVTPREFPLIGTATMIVRDTHAKAGLLMADGARMVITFKDEYLMSGPVDEVELDSESGTLAVTVIDDAHILHRIAGWQAPAAAITAQGSAEYKTYTGDAETVIKAAVTENGVTRLGIPGLVVAPNLHRGATVPGGVATRMHPLPDRFFPALALAGIGCTVQQVGSDLVFDVYVPREYPRILSVEGRTLKKVVWSRQRPKASRVVIGGPGEAKLRRFRQLTDTAREAEWGFVGEVFRDARDALDDGDPEVVANTSATMDARGQETLDESGVINGLSVTLAESTVFTYGEKGVRVGDRANVRHAGTIITDTLKEAVIEWISPDYASVEPLIGSNQDPAAKTAATQAALKESQRKEERA